MVPVVQTLQLHIINYAAGFVAAKQKLYMKINTKKHTNAICLKKQTKSNKKLLYINKTIKTTTDRCPNKAKQATVKRYKTINSFVELFILQKIAVHYWTLISLYR